MIFSRMLSEMAETHSHVQLSNLSQSLTLSMPGGLSDTVSASALRTVYNKYLYFNLKRNYSFIAFQVDSSNTLSKTYYESGLDDIIPVWKLFADTIAYAEIAARGVVPCWNSPKPKSEMHSRLIRIGILDTVPKSTLNYLAVLGQTCNSTLLLDNNISERSMLKFCTSFLEALIGPVENQFQQLIHPPLLFQDGFSHLSIVCLAIMPSYGKTSKDHLQFWIQLMAFFEFVRSFASLIEHVLILNSFLDDIELSYQPSLKDTEQYIKLLNRVINGLGLQDHRDALLRLLPAEKVLQICQNQQVIFMRKTVLLMYGKFGIVPPGGAVGFEYDQSAHHETMHQDEPGESEFVRLTKYLDLPSLSDMMVLDEELERLVQFWCSDFAKDTDLHWTNILSGQGVEKPLLEMERLSIYQLVALPNRLDHLLEECIAKVCKKCNQVPHDPAICLFCGEMVCSQSFCCADMDKGESNLHMERFFC